MTTERPAPRPLHFVGTLPQFTSAEHALRWQRDELVAQTRSWFGGETGARSQWFVPVVKRLQTAAKVHTKKNGSWSDYDDVDRLAVRRGARLTPDDIPLRIADDFRDEHEVLCSIIGSPPTKPIQVGIPGYLDMALFTFGPVGLVKYARTYRRALSRQIEAIETTNPGGAVFQLEVPFALIALATLPRRVQRAAAGVLARLVLAQVRNAPPGTCFGVHLCLGDLGHHALRQLKDTAPLAYLTTALVRSWPRHTTLDFVHLPLSGGEKTPSTAAAFYAPLRRLRGLDVPLVAGFAHEHQSLEEQLCALRLVETALDRRVGIATSCGLGRRSPAGASAAIERMLELARS